MTSKEIIAPHSQSAEHHHVYMYNEIMVLIAERDAAKASRSV